MVCVQSAYGSCLYPSRRVARNPPCSRSKPPISTAILKCEASLRVSTSSLAGKKPKQARGKILSSTSLSRQKARKSRCKKVIRKRSILPLSAPKLNRPDLSWLSKKNGIEKNNKEGKTKLQRLPRRTHEIAQHCHVRTISADAPRIHRQSQRLGEIKIDTRIVQLRQTKSLRRQYAINPRRIHRPRRTMTLPWTARQLVKLFPIAFVPGRHFVFYYSST